MFSLLLKSEYKQKASLRRLYPMLYRIFLFSMIPLMIGCGASTDKSDVSGTNQLTSIEAPPTTAARIVPTTVVEAKPTNSAKTAPTTVAETKPTTAAKAAPTTVAEAKPTIAAKTAPTTAPKSEPTKTASDTESVNEEKPWITIIPTALPKLSPLPPASDVSRNEQKKLLSKLVTEWFVGMNNTELRRLNLTPDVRDNRRGGILVHIEINGDEYPSTTQKKQELDKLMRDTYELLYSTGYEVTEVAITAAMEGLVRPIIGGVVKARLQAFRSRLRIKEAEKIDWANKESLDFNEIWENVILTGAWKRELAEEAESSK